MEDLTSVGKLIDAAAKLADAKLPNKVAALDVLPRRAGRIGREPEADATDRRAAPAHAFLRFPRDEPMAHSTRLRFERQASAAAYAGHGPGGRLSATADQRAFGRTSNSPVFPKEFGDRAARPGVERGHRLCDYGFMYLVAVLDLYSRYVLSWELESTALSVV